MQGLDQEVKVSKVHVLKNHSALLIKVQVVLVAPVAI